MTVRVRKIKPDHVDGTGDTWSVRCSRDRSNGGTCQQRYPTHEDAVAQAVRHAQVCQHGQFGFQTRGVVS